MLLSLPLLPDDAGEDWEGGDLLGRAMKGRGMRGERIGETSDVQGERVVVSQVLRGDGEEGGRGAGEKGGGEEAREGPRGGGGIWRYLSIEGGDIRDSSKHRDVVPCWEGEGGRRELGDGSWVSDRGDGGFDKILMSLEGIECGACVPEDELVRDCVLVLLGVGSSLFSVDKGAGRVNLVGKVRTTGRSTESTMKVLQELSLAGKFRKLSPRVNAKSPFRKNVLEIRLKCVVLAVHVPRFRTNASTCAGIVHP